MRLDILGALSVALGLGVGCTPVQAPGRHSIGSYWHLLRWPVSSGNLLCLGISWPRRPGDVQVLSKHVAERRGAHRKRGRRGSQGCAFNVVSVLVVPAGTRAHPRAPTPLNPSYTLSLLHAASASPPGVRQPLEPYLVSNSVGSASGSCGKEISLMTLDGQFGSSEDR